MKERIAAIGTFDGVHRGHRSVLKVLIDYARLHNMEPVALSFRAHPLALIDPSRCPKDLTPLWKKKNLLKEAGATPMIIDFDEDVRATTAAQWMKRLHDEFGVKALVIGYDNTFGCDGVTLSLEDYKKIGAKENIEVLTAEEIPGVSSSKIRKTVLAGDVEKAGEMLGRPYSITSKVVEGNRLGRSLGFPTANISVPENQAIPKPGVYAAIVKTLNDGVKHPAMVNVGTRPTLMRGDDLVVEAHLIDWEGDLYGKEITVRFIKRLRDEKKFDSIEDLKVQLAEDRRACMDVLK